jgi:hypothetical protein
MEGSRSRQALVVTNFLIPNAGAFSYMFESIKQDWQCLKRGEPGERFVGFYDYRASRRHPGFSVSRAVTILFGLVLTIGGASIGWLPGPGGFVAIFGLALLAQEFRPMAVALDWCEVRLRAIWQWCVRVWKRMSGAARVAIAMTALVTSVSLAVAAYAILLR